MVGHLGVADAVPEDAVSVARGAMPEVLALLLAGKARELFAGLTHVGRAEGRAVAVTAEHVDDAVAVERARALLHLRAELAGEAAGVALAEDAVADPGKEPVGVL